MKGKDVAQELQSRGITIRTGDIPSLAEEASQSYKDIAEVIDVVHQAGISKRVAMAVPIGVIKG
ncbi:MAG: RtcB family protein, partial [Chloroflexota bacterium]|nr:RtcB family protein [Chloroflexota bacterium]